MEEYFNEGTPFKYMKSHPDSAKPMLAAVLIKENETVVKTNRECELCGGKVDKYDKFTEEEHCQKCGWS